MTYRIYRETASTGTREWGVRQDEALAIRYAETVRNLYMEGGDLARPDDPLIHVRVQEDRSGEIPWRWDAPR